MLMFFLDDTGEYYRKYLGGGGAVAASAPAASAAGKSASAAETLAREAVPMRALIERISQIATMSPTELSEAMGSEEGSAIARFKTEEIEPDALLRPWNKIGRASPRALSEEEYERFLGGEHPTAGTAELYGGHLGHK